LIASEAGAASRLYRDLAGAEAADLGLDPRLAVAAADDALLQRWLDFVGLPMHSA
jgi:myo-inositol-1(or 4)-monophosphatase